MKICNFRFRLEFRDDAQETQICERLSSLDLVLGYAAWIQNLGYSSQVIYNLLTKSQDTGISDKTVEIRGRGIPSWLSGASPNKRLSIPLHVVRIHCTLQLEPPM